MRARLFTVIAVLRLAAVCGAEPSVDFVKDVQPILAEHCIKCHGPLKQRSDYRLDNREVALKRGSIGGAVVPGDADASKLIQYVSGTHETIRMPAEGDPLSDEKVATLRAWINQGARWPDEASAVLEDGRDHWAWKPLSKISPPVPVDAAGRNPIDGFIRSTLRQRDMSPSSEADKRTLIRRVTYNLTGLPPTPDDVAAFVTDASPDAYERLVDRLLASPRYGERWARHWIDVVHFAETHGHDEDKPRENAWPYRDYLVRSFNDDKPYARFVQEQIAGDALFPEDPQATVALGFLAGGPWDQSSQMGIVDGTLDKKIAQVLDRDDMIATALGTFNSLTIHCARCHDHKFDPITQADYYSLQAVFSGVDRHERPYDPDAQVHIRRKALTQHKRELESAGPSPALLDPQVQQQVAAWERQVNSGTDVWVTLTPGTFTAIDGSVAAAQPDGSLLYGGPRPERDTYTLTVPTRVRGITAVQLEVLTDPNLPREGPGRQDNGNLHLSEFEIRLGDTPVPIRRATADFNQSGWTIEHSIDGNPATAWGIFPEVGKSHAAVFELSRPVDADSLTFVLKQLHGAGHLIGRLRLAVTASRNPAAARPIPQPIRAILDVAPTRRTANQQMELALYVMKQKVEDELAALPSPGMVYAITSEFAAQGNFKPAVSPRPVHVLRRGDITQPLDVAAPGALSCIAGLESRFTVPDPNDEASRRAALARWIAHPQHPLTWRSIVNRVWHYHFGRGIVDTPNDLGKMGGTPSHPELLDWLAVEFRDSGGSLKHLHRLIVTSATYRQNSSHRDECAAMDDDNRLLWRMNRPRLDAEQVRDSALVIAGRLDLKMGGPSVKQFIQKPGIHVTPIVDYQNFDADNPANWRRGVYRFLFRTIPDPLMESLDCPAGDQHAPTRQASVTALQALAMLNNKLMVRLAEHAAERLARMHPGVENQIRELYQMALGRDPQAAEMAKLAPFARQYGMANLCRVVLNSNEFMFLD